VRLLALAAPTRLSFPCNPLTPPPPCPGQRRIYQAFNSLNEHQMIPSSTNNSPGSPNGNNPTPQVLNLFTTTPPPTVHTQCHPPSPTPSVPSALSSVPSKTQRRGQILPPLSHCRSRRLRKLGPPTPKTILKKGLSEVLRECSR
jgi:hypothetical protein